VIKKIENEEAKAHYRAVENTTTMGCNARKTNNKQHHSGELNKVDYFININVKMLCACAVLNNKHKPIDSRNMHLYPEIVYADK
jgi:hypothetical protein